MKKRSFAAAVILCSVMAVSPVFAADDFYAPSQETDQGGTGEMDEDGFIYINFDNYTLDEALAQFRDQFDGVDVKLRAGGSDKTCFQFLTSVQCGSLSLAGVKRLYYGDADGFWSLSDVPGLTSLSYDEDGTASIDMDELGPFEDLTDLTINVESFSTGLQGKISSALMPNLKRLTMCYGSPSYMPDSRGLIFPQTLAEVELKFNEETDPSEIEYPAGFIAGLESCCPDAVINGEPVSDFAHSLIESGRFTQEEYDLASSDSVLFSLYDDVKNGRLQASGSGDAYGGKMVFLIAKGGIDRTSIEALASGEDFYEIPEEQLAETLEEADTVAIVYRDIELAGYYTMGNAYRTYTNVAVVDPKSRTLLQKYNVAVNEPPETIEVTTINGVPMGGSGYGDFEDVKAVADVMARAVTESGAQEDAGGNESAGLLFEADETLCGQILDALQSDQYRAAYEAIAGGETIESGSKGDTAQAVQQLLVDLGCGIDVDGSVGPKTIGALNEVQEAFGLKATESVDADLFIQLLGMRLISKDEDAADELLSSAIGEQSEDPGYYSYMKGCAFQRAGRFYKAMEAYEESGYKDSAVRAASCRQDFPESGEIWRNGRVSGTDMILHITVNSGSEDSGMCFHIYTDDAQLASVLFMRGSGTVTTSLPGGTYRIKDGSGRQWYGTTDAFGRDGYYEFMSFNEEAEGIDQYRVPLESGHEYTITINVSDLEEGASQIASDSTDWESWAG